MSVRLPARTPVLPQDHQKEAKRQLKRILGSIDVARETIAMTDRRMKADLAMAEKVMRENKMDRFVEGRLTAEISEDIGNGKTTWDMPALQKKLGKDFLEAVDPVKKRVESYLTAKEIADVSTFTAGVSKGASFKIIQAK